MKKLEQLLTKDQFNRFIYNLYFHNRHLCKNINYIKTNINLDPASIIHTAFTWDSTKEGHDYWSKRYRTLGIYERASKITE